MVTFEGETKDMTPSFPERYETDFTAPIKSGDYSAEIHAFDDAGNVSIANSETNEELTVKVKKWEIPKTNWGVNDRFNFKDYNRIKNNLEYLHKEASDLWKQFNVEDMGEEVSDYVTSWKVRYFNAWEKNIEIINNIILTKDYGQSQTFYENGVFIQFGELNRIESAILSMKDILERQKAGLRRLSFRLGKFKEVEI